MKKEKPIPNKKFSDILAKLEEYSTEIIKEYYLDELSEFIILTKQAIITYKPKGDLVIIAFHVSTRPDDAAALVLILFQIDWMKDVRLAEVFTQTKERSVLNGEEAFEFVKNLEREAILKEHEAMKQLNNILIKCDESIVN